MSKYLLAVAFVAAFVLAGCNQPSPELTPAPETTTIEVDEVMIDNTAPTDGEVMMEDDAAPTGDEAMMEEVEEAVEDKMEKDETAY
jgi:PBP1b-binding outer membrane lipoprotein LpoB